MSDLKAYSDWEQLQLDTDYDAIMPTNRPGKNHKHFIEQVKANELSKDEIVKYLEENL